MRHKEKQINAWLLKFLAKSKQLISEDLTIEQFEIFLTIAVEPGLIAKEIRERLNLSGGMLTRNTKALSTYYVKKGDKEEKKGLGLVDIRPGKYDMRANEFHLTDKGQEVVKKIHEEIAEVAQMITGLNEEGDSPQLELVKGG